ncbi:Asp23/Gls24 family envelope stress response protein [Camelliibacillus cellulosilyticus]|uniref:Asp23/Gls24 family envelope stress response protein n=1 Tax=Camelliibacillus cellulosilyticus TaxID=2174486 RepID=A0ABV9GK94_9BACL
MFEMDDVATDLGKVEISPEVIEVIAGLAASEIDGVTAMHGGFATGVAERMGRKNYGKGVKVDLGDEGITIDVQLYMRFGVSIPEVGRLVQENIAQTLRTMTSLEALAINIHVVGIQFDAEKLGAEAKD